MYCSKLSGLLLFFLPGHVEQHSDLFLSGLCFLIGGVSACVSEQGLAEGNGALANRAAVEAKEARATAESRAEQAEAQVDHGKVGGGGGEQAQQLAVCCSCYAIRTRIMYKHCPLSASQVKATCFFVDISGFDFAGWPPVSVCAHHADMYIGKGSVRTLTTVIQAACLRLLPSRTKAGLLMIASEINYSTLLVDMVNTSWWQVLRAEGSTLLQRKLCFCAASHMFYRSFYVHVKHV